MDAHLWLSLAVAFGVAAAIAAFARPRLSKQWYHHLDAGTRTPRMTNKSSDFVDYCLMLILCCIATRLSFGRAHPFVPVTIGCSIYLLACFALRHGTCLQVPVILRQPLALPYLLLSKLRNLRGAPLLTISSLCLEQCIIAQTPHWAHHTATYSWLCNRLFYVSFIAITAVRTLSLGLHLANRAQVFHFLKSTQWSKSLLGSAGEFRQAVDIFHAYVTGIQCHILALAPLYCVLCCCEHSMLLMPVRMVLDCVAMKWFWSRDFGEWLYRDHWLCHHSELAFVYLHAPHHDALPISIMAAHDTGMLEGFLRFCLGQPETFCTPLLGSTLFGVSVLLDFVFHQYVPGVFPYSSTVIQYGHHHAEHHFLSLHPLGPGMLCVE